MREFINRFLNIRGVIKDIYMQISEVRVVNRDRSKSIGKHPRETYTQWLNRSKEPYTWTWEYHRDHYIEEVGGIVKMGFQIEGVLVHLQHIYYDLISILNCGLPFYLDEDLETPDDPTEDVMDVLNPKVDLDGLKEAMAHDMRLCHISERIYNVIYHGHSDNARPHLFYLQHTYKMWLILRANRLSTSEAIHVKQWSMVEDVKHGH